MLTLSRYTQVLYIHPQAIYDIVKLTFLKMGVGAVFISTLAISRLETPEDPPQNQQQLLAATLQPIVAFIVLCSIIIHGLSIPFFSLSREVGSRMLSLSRTRTLTLRGPDVPDWLFGSRRPPALTTTPAPDVEHGEGTIVAEDGMSDARVSIEQDQIKGVREAQPVLGKGNVALRSER
ncbi:hypothetical protein EWM64_g6773 [Hericium alpestre]|uniref:Cation/H+ exchanger domain-containing protein n=1 Tax=Hericium alpestre TaxID=135208 RepID=A0A4Y9ZQR3_9AGAM|nr:hypothetical protein EWM64_g6773 [Hericium alpestre]